MKEIKRFRIHVRFGRNNPFLIKLTDHSSAKVRRAVENAGPGAYHVFDYSSQQAVIMGPGHSDSQE